MRSSVDCDILVVGAGPAGSSAAAAAARRGANALLIDAKTRIGEQPHCGEFVPRQLFTEFSLDRGSIIQSVEGMETWIVDLNGARSGSKDPNEWVTLKKETASSGFLIDRVRFDRDLAREAAACGATVLSSTRLVRREDESWIARNQVHEFPIHAKLIIAADGAISSVATALGMRPPEFLRGTQIEAPLARPLNKTFVFLSRKLVGGYGWLFPKGKVANVGLGVIARGDVHPGRLLDDLLSLVKALGLIREGVLARSGGPIPVSGIRDSLVEGNVIFCGDAAGLTHPITGAGIPQAVFSGQAAGRAAAAASAAGRLEPLCAYDNDIRSMYHGILAHARTKRDLMISLWNDPDFEKTCEQTWISSKGYRKRAR